MRDHRLGRHRPFRQGGDVQIGDQQHLHHPRLRMAPGLGLGVGLGARDAGLDAVLHSEETFGGAID